VLHSAAQQHNALRLVHQPLQQCLQQSLYSPKAQKHIYVLLVEIHFGLIYSKTDKLEKKG
tara:strand:- start:532 stop:711 length:180 start_codon:yes stop_codon:yes gene_type:complete